MFHSTTDVYQVKRKVIHFAKSIVSQAGQVESKFVTQSIYGILKSGSVILKDMAVALRESGGLRSTFVSRNSTLGLRIFG